MIWTELIQTRLHNITATRTLTSASRSSKTFDPEVKASIYINYRANTWAVTSARSYQRTLYVYLVILSRIPRLAKTTKRRLKGPNGKRRSKEPKRQVSREMERRNRSRVSSLSLAASSSKSRKTWSLIKYVPLILIAARRKRKKNKCLSQ